MAQLIVLDPESAVYWRDGKAHIRSLAESIEHIKELQEPSEILLFDTEVIKFHSTKEAVDEKCREKAGPNTLFVTQQLGDNFYQAIVCSEQIVRDCRRAGFEGVIAPYVVALQQAITALFPSGDDTMSSTMVVDSTTDAIVDATVVLDAAGDDILMTITAGPEVLYSRRLVSLHNLELEIVRTLKAARIARGRVLTNSREIGVLTETLGLPVRDIKSPEPIAYVGAEHLDKQQFRLLEEVVAERKWALRRRQALRVFVSVGFSGLMLLLLLLAVGRNFALESSLAGERQRKQEAEQRLQAAARDRFASSVTDTGPSVAFLWFELDVSLPAQLAVTRVESTPTLRKAELDQRPDIDATPVSRQQVMGVLANLEAWKDARVSEKFTPQSVTFVVEKARTP